VASPSTNIAATAPWSAVYVPGDLLSCIVLAPPMKRAACRGRHDLFDRAADGDPLAQQTAVDLCHHCPHLDVCGAFRATLRPKDLARGVLAGVLVGKAKTEPRRAGAVRAAGARTRHRGVVPSRRTIRLAAQAAARRSAAAS
jgi:hypothetical protein